MVHVIMMCGVCGSGKTTYAKQKEKQGYIRLSIDEEMWINYGKHGVDYPVSEYDHLSEETEKKLRQKMIKLIKTGQNLVIDFSFWNKVNRDKYRKLILEAGGIPELVYMKADKEVLRKRIEARNQSIHANSPFVITDEILDHHYNGFQEPVGEGEIVLIQE
jgi:predicted kinase